jgi:hypothetical protein
MIVAVKQLNQLLQEGRDLLDFLNEIEIMRYVRLFVILRSSFFFGSHHSDLSIASSLRHQNIVTFYGTCIQPPHVCIGTPPLLRLLQLPPPTH